jgi:hypothetical protein
MGMGWALAGKRHKATLYPPALRGAEDFRIVSGMTMRRKVIAL